MTRREVLQRIGCGFGTLGMTQALMAKSGGGPLAPKAPHFPPKVKQVIFLFLNGGISQVDTFDPKPALTRYNGQPMELLQPKVLPSAD